MRSFYFSILTSLYFLSGGRGALSFFTTAAFRTWFADSGLSETQLRSRYKLKYLKGLASSNEDDAHHYFQNLQVTSREEVGIEYWKTRKNGR